jgi:hypothetical protein
MYKHFPLCRVVPSDTCCSLGHASQRPSYRHRLDILFVDFLIHPSGPASTCSPSTHLYTDFLCLLADPLGFEDPPPGIRVAARTRSWSDIIAVSAVSYAVCALLFPPEHLLRPKLLPWTVWMTCVPLSSWILLLRRPGCCLTCTFPVLAPRWLACLVLRTWSVITRFPLLVYTSCSPGVFVIKLRPPP